MNLTVQRIGSGSGSCSLNYVVNDGTAVAGTDYTDESGSVSWTDGDTADKTIDVVILDRSGVQGDRTFDVVLSADTCSDTLDITTATVTIKETDSSSAWSAHTESYDSIFKDFACLGCDWSTYLATSPTRNHCVVTNLSAGTDQGSLKNCIEGQTSGSELNFVVFAVGGKIDCGSNDSIVIANDGLVVAGASAPPPGINTEGCSWKIRANHIWIDNVSVFGDADNEGDGKGFIVTGGSGGPTISNVVVSNVNVAFTYDSLFQFDRNVENASLIQGQLVYPVGESGGFNKECITFGQDDSDLQQVSRTMCAHFNGRAAKANGVANFNYLNNVDYNWLNNAMDVNKNETMQGNIEGNVFVEGSAGQANSPITCRNVAAGTDIYVDGNRTNGGQYSDASETSMVSDTSANCDVVTSSRQATFPTGYTVESIGADEAGERAFVVLVSDFMGAFSTNRIPFWQLVPNQILERIDDDSGGGSVLPSNDPSAHPLGGYPTITGAECDPDTADDCGTGKPALPSDWGGTGSHIDAGFTYVNDVRCAEAATGATGC